MARNPSLIIVIMVALIAVLGGMALATQDKYTVRVPDGLSFTDFKGYEDWQDVAVSRLEDGDLKVILANPVMIAAYRAGIPGNGKPFPDGSKIAKIHWSAKRNTEAPFVVTVLDILKSVQFIEKDSIRFPDTSGWGYAPFVYDAASDSYAPDKTFGSGAKCGYSCHTAVAAKDYIFTAYAKR